jgi:hypothetical protein
MLSYSSRSEVDQIEDGTRFGLNHFFSDCVGSVTDLTIRLQAGLPFNAVRDYSAMPVVAESAER